MQGLGLVDPTIAIAVSMCFLIILLYKRLNLGIVLNATAFLLAVLALDWNRIPGVIYATTDPMTADGKLAISVVLATFAVMLLSQLYRETGMINKLSESISKIVKNPKIVLCVLPAVIGLLPVAGGALMSAPLVDTEAEKLKLKSDRKAYLNLWFRHTIFPVYPISQPLIVAAAMMGVAVPIIILRQIPVVLVMVATGYIIGFWRVSHAKSQDDATTVEGSKAKQFLTVFSPIMITIIVAVTIGGVWPDLSKQGFDVLTATIVGLAALILVSRLSFKVFTEPFKSWGIYGITFAAYGAFLLRNIMVNAGISQIFKVFVSNGNVDIILLLTLVPAVLGLLTGSPQGGVAIGVSILAGIVAFSPKIAALVYISAYLGYTVAPTHLCFTFTAQYFKCPLGRLYRYVIPSFILTFMMALIVYFFL
jgi:integral membrane protein (TIGR00529 family)